MDGKLDMSETFRFDEPGTLVKPGPIGRIVRMAFGILCLWIVWQLILYSSTADLRNPSFWFLVALGLLLAPYVVNIGFGVTWGAWPRIISAAVFLIAATISYTAVDAVLGFPLWIVLAAWMDYVYGHLGIAFVLSAVLATPGCEMRSIPHLFGWVRKQDTREHYCPGFIDNVDRWETSRRGRKSESGVDETPAPGNRGKDIVGNAGGQLLVYGLPFVALQLAGNLGGFGVATSIPAIAFLFVAAACIYNAWRSRRVHCFFLGPWCLLAGVMTALYSLRVIDFGPSSWSLIVNTGLAGAAIIYIGSERLWGRYFDGK